MPISIKKGFSGVELLVVLILVFILSYFAYRAYFVEKIAGKEGTQFLSEQGIDGRNYKTAIDSTRQKIREIQKERLNAIPE